MVLSNLLAPSLHLLQETFAVEGFCFVLEPKLLLKLNSTETLRRCLAEKANWFHAFLIVHKRTDGVLNHSVVTSGPFQSLLTVSTSTRRFRS